MKEFNYKLDYKKLDFTDAKTRKLYRIGRGEQGVLLIRPYTEDICAHWRFKTPEEAKQSATIIYAMFRAYLEKKDFISADMARKFLEMGFTRSRRYANHHSGCKYNKDRTVKPQELDHATCHYAESASIFLEYRRKAASNVIYKALREQWRKNEESY